MTTPEALERELIACELADLAEGWLRQLGGRTVVRSMDMVDVMLDVRKHALRLRALTTQESQP